MSTITIIDDDHEVRVATQNLIRSYGLDAETFASAEAFLSSSMVESTACVITDVQMPGMSGLELQGALKALGYAIPIIFITAFPEDRLRRQVEAAGAFGFLIKPFEAVSLITCIEKALGPSPL